MTEYSHIDVYMTDDQKRKLRLAAQNSQEAVIWADLFKQSNTTIAVTAARARQLEAKRERGPTSNWQGRKRLTLNRNEVQLSMPPAADQVLSPLTATDGEPSVETPMLAESSDATTMTTLTQDIPALAEEMKQLKVAKPSAKKTSTKSSAKKSGSGKLATLLWQAKNVSGGAPVSETQFRQVSN